MCGIFGVFNYKNKFPTDHRLVKESTYLLAHRGPDGEGFYFDDERGIGFGHRRLSIIDLTTGDQPMANEDKTVWIVFNGEIYNYEELRDYLVAKGHIFRTKSDTEVIIHAYEEFGEDTPKKLNGIFAFAIWDAKKNSLFLARDHFGVKPLYYYYDDEKVVFASELKAILHYTKIRREINDRALYFCLTLRHTPAPYTLINNINKVPASHFISVNNNTLLLKRYWDYKVIIDHKKTEKEWIEELKEKFELSVKRQMMADVPVGISLSGGIDSGAILALMSRYEGKGVHAFTIGFEGNKEEDNEIERARENAERFGVEFNFEIISEHDYLNFMDKYLWHLEEPVGNESAIAYYFVARLAKGKVKVLLNGQGADEPLAGYDRYIGMYYADKFKIPSFLSKYLAHFFISLDRRNQLLRLTDYLKYSTDSEKIVSSASILSPELRSSLFSEKLKRFDNYHLLKNEVENILRDYIDGNTVEKMLFYDMFSSLSENLLLSEDKMAMAASIEARVPFLDIELAKTMLSIPINKKIKGKSGKYIHKKLCEKYLPKKVVYQRKIGFNNPMDKWLKNSIGSELLDYIATPNSLTKKYLNEKEVNNYLNAHKKGLSDNQRFLFLLLSLEKWNKMFILNNYIV